MALLLPGRGKSYVCALRRLGQEPVYLNLFVLLGLIQPVEVQIVVIIPSRHIPDLDMSSVLREEDIRPGVGHKRFYNFALMKRNGVLYPGVFPHSCCVYLSAQLIGQRTVAISSLPVWSVLPLCSGAHCCRKHLFYKMDHSINSKSVKHT
jgi:hypothetical protein